jgi:glycerol-3-phosphate dehydrogenase (NAD(P)+)
VADLADPGAAIAVLGAGSWGSALAVLLARNGERVWLWGRDADQVAAMCVARCNSRYLPGVHFPDSLQPCDGLAQAVTAGTDVLVSVPSHAFRATLQALAALPSPVPRLAWATKGFEPGSGRLLDEVAREVLGQNLVTAVLSGPSFAGEVARELPTAVTLASADHDFAAALARRLSGPAFRAYTHDDVVGVQVCGGVKNVLAIAAGIADGLGFGANARAALVTRGLAELARLGVAMGGRAATFSGLAGLGDLLLTCTDDQSRNRRFGLALAAGVDAQQAQSDLGQVVEGYRNTREVMALARRWRVEMPICRQVHAVLFEGTTPRNAVQALMSRQVRDETDPASG